MSKRTTPGYCPDRDLPESGPVTDLDSRIVVSDARHQDVVEVTEVVRRIADGQVPDQLRVVERHAVYHGPELVTTDGAAAYLLTAPGPDSHLLCWRAVTDDAGCRKRWTQLAEVTARLGDDSSGDRRCNACGEPIRSAEHARRSTLGQCPE